MSHMKVVSLGSDRMCGQADVRRYLIESSLVFFSIRIVQCGIQCAPIDIHLNSVRDRMSKSGLIGWPMWLFSTRM